MLMEKMKKLAFVTPDMLGIPPQFCHKRMWAAAEKGTSPSRNNNNNIGCIISER
jgi:hypothetical protein